MADLSTLQTRLTEAENALHSLAQGKRAVTVQFEGRSVTYTQATMAELTTYVGYLRGEVAAAAAASTGTKRNRQVRLYGGKGF